MEKSVFVWFPILFSLCTRPRSETQKGSNVPTKALKKKISKVANMDVNRAGFKMLIELALQICFIRKEM